MRAGHTFTGFVAVVLMVLISFAPSVKGDGGYIPVSPADVYESGQNAVIGWDGEVERLYLSVNIYADQDTNGFHIIPFPSMPEISLGSLSIFDNCSEHLGDFRTEHTHTLSSGDGNSEGREKPVEVLLQETIGEHDVTVIRVNDVTGFKDELMEIIDEIGMDINSWPDGLNRIITNYTVRGYNYFSIDNYPIYKREKTVDPLVYQFETDVLFFPLEISSMLEGESIVRLAFFTDPKIPLDLSILDDVLSYRHRSYQFVSSEILSYIDKDLYNMFPEGAIHEYYVFHLPLSRVRGDVIIPRDDMISWADTFDEYLNWNYEANIYHIPELGLIVYQKRNIESLMVCCRDFEDGELAWEWTIPCEPHDHPNYFGLFIEDLDQDGSSDILVYTWDFFNADFSIVRLDPLTGEEIEMDLPELDFIPEKGQVFMDLNGSKYFGFLSEYKMIVVDPETMNCIATLEMPEPDNWGGGPRIPLDDYLMHTWDGIGEGISFHDDRRHCAWSPFHQLTEEERNSSGFIDDNIIWQQGFRFQFEYIHDGMTYWFGTRWVSTPATYLHIFDPDTGNLLDNVSYEEFPELKECLEYLVFDFNGNGEDDLIAVYSDGSRGDGLFHVACLDPISGERYWDTELRLGDYWFKGLKVVDLGGDGSSVFIIHSRDTVNVIDSADGTIIWSESYSFLREGNPDLDGDGRKEIIIFHYPSYLKVIDPFTGDETLNISHSREEVIPIICTDLNQDGFEDIIYIKQYPWGSHIPSEITIRDGKTGDEMRYPDIPWPSFIFEGDDSTLIIIETQSRGLGINFNAEMMEKLQSNETVGYHITILEEGPSEDEGSDIFKVAPLFLLACLVATILYLMVVKRKKR